MTDASSLASLLPLLQSSHDERKLAGLLLVTRVVVGPKWPVEVLNTITEAVGTLFLRRLLRSADHDGAYVILATDLISALVASSDATKLLSRDDLCSDIIMAQKNRLTLDLFALYTAFINVGDPAPLSLLSSLWRDNCQHLLLKKVIRAWVCPEFTQQILFSPHHNVMALVAQDFKSCQELRKFQALELIVAILSQLHPFGDVSSEHFTEFRCQSELWASDIRDGLSQVLASRVNAQQRRMALLASWFLLDLYGYSWASAGESITAHFPTLLMTNVAIESRLLLECYAERPAAVTDDFETLRACFIIVNMAISFLVDDDTAFELWKRKSKFHWSHLPLESFMLIYSRISEVVRSIFDFLAECESQDRLQDDILPSVFRVLSTWMSEDSQMFQSDLETSCSFLVKVCQESKDPFDPLVILMPVFARLSLDPSGAERLVECDFLSQVLRLMRSLPAGSREESALMAGDACQLLDNLVEYFPSTSSDPILQELLVFRHASDQVDMVM